MALAALLSVPSWEAVARQNRCAKNACGFSSISAFGGCDGAGQFLTGYGEQIMPLKLASAVAVLALSAPAFGLTAVYPTDPSLQGTTVAAETFTIDTQAFGEPLPPPVPVFFVDEKIVRNGTGTLDFYFKLRNVSDPQPLRYFDLSFANSVQGSAFYVDEGNLAPAGAGFGSLGAGYIFGGEHDIVGPIIGAGGTDTLLLRTNAITFTNGTVEAFRQSFDDFEIQPATGLVPDAGSVPEPSGLALLSVGLVGLSMRFRRPWRSVRLTEWNEKERCRTCPAGPLPHTTIIAARLVCWCELCFRRGVSDVIPSSLCGVGGGCPFRMCPVFRHDVRAWGDGRADGDE